MNETGKEKKLVDRTSRKPGKKKKPYVKAELKRVPLRPEEAVLGACKTESTAGPSSGPCTTFPCSTSGS
ncbi:hypothetical protein ACFLU6_09590 [Acidobacteriota bacterium]